MITKQCSKCKETKSIEDFKKIKSRKSGLHSWCKKCSAESERQRYKNNPEKVKEINKRWRMNHHEKAKGKCKQYYKDNTEKHKKVVRQWQINNPEKIREVGKRRRSNPTYRLSQAISIGIWRTLKTGKDSKCWEELVGYTLRGLITYIEKQFIDGMSWNNQGKWHIDHIIPISLWKFESFNDREFKQCWSLINLQPLWAKENIKKRNNCGSFLGGDN
jgi:hypothetical protein